MCQARNITSRIFLTQSAKPEILRPNFFVRRCQPRNITFWHDANRHIREHDLSKKFIRTNMTMKVTSVIYDILITN